MDFNIKIEAEELPITENGKCISFTDFKQSIDIKDEIEVGDTQLLDGNSFVENNNIEGDVKNEFLSPIQSYCKQEKYDEDRDNSFYGDAHLAKSEENQNEIIHERNEANSDVNFDEATSKSAQLNEVQCPFCDYSGSTIRRHIDAVHFGLKKHKCKQCNFSTNYCTAFTKHVTNHHKLQDYKCEFCDYATSVFGRFRMHIELVHQKTIIYKCQHCDFTSSVSGVLSNHIRKVHLRPKCENCNYSTYKASTLERHIKSIHQN